MTKTEKRNITISTIAKEAGCSTTTVSLVLNNRAEKWRISDKTVERILKTAERLHYVPDASARSLSSKRSGIIGAIFENLKHDWADTVMSGMRSVLDREGYIPYITTHQFDGSSEQSEIRTLLERRVEAIITVPLGNMETYRPVLARRVPLIFLHDMSEEMPEASFVAWDEGGAARAAVQHLIETGCKRIAFVSYDDPRGPYKARYSAYRQAIKEAGLEERDEWVKFIIRGKEDLRDIAQMFESGESRPDALFAGEDPPALLALEVFQKMELRVPEDVSVIGIGNLPVTRYPIVGLTTIPAPMEDHGREAALAALQLIRDPGSGPIHKVIPCKDVIIRKTTAKEMPQREKEKV